ncbi:hypothetical protein P171DRAFT_422057 [Karstenula rhodostoma CBS 690.94]|uniref:Small nuclear ribonucleoprotein Prp3 C-terminal domain-containing protein n=1 Tax=Karstenula rhodostoma CBS 690.94 TaxID=1392251 RepID=A0A9P4P8Y6_9PLEO|nr:hypothetical protein P171DRAFT_422057 [Karstenula rhodostoma CBS 690.94]
MAASSWFLLPPELIEHQIAQIDLLMAMYPEEEVSMENLSQDALGVLKASIENNTLSKRNTLNTSTITLLLSLEISENTTLQLDINVPFTHESEAPPEEAPHAKIRIRQPPWLNRAATSQLNAQVSETEDLFTAIDDIKQAASDLLQSQAALAAQSNIASKSAAGPLVRAWFYFPSISTRSKRDDFIINAPAYALTGFLFAGKPGLLCLEGTSSNIDAYMKFIKTESWGDIPSHHKKVSERLREEGGAEGVQRVFADMREITDEVGERRGARANRGDMGAVEGWLGERGLGEALGRVLM